jgi:hypothetical protein
MSGQFQPSSAGAAASSAPEGAEAAVLLLHQLGRMRLVETPLGPPVAAAVLHAGRQDALRNRHQVRRRRCACVLGGALPLP